MRRRTYHSPPQVIPVSGMSPASLAQVLVVAKYTGIAHTICTRPTTAIFHIGRSRPPRAGAELSNIHGAECDKPGL